MFTAVVRALRRSQGGLTRFVRLGCLLACALGLTLRAGQAGATPSILYTFSPLKINSNRVLTNADGASPSSQLLLASDGKLYGTTSQGGTNGCGTIFQLSTTGTFVNLYTFSIASNSSGATLYDINPNDLTEGSNGLLYGTTRNGGDDFSGTIFSISTQGAFSNLYTFTAPNQGGIPQAGGSQPVGAMVLAGDGNIYGTTQYGGSNGTGTIFQFTPSGQLTSLFSFGAIRGSDRVSGAYPNALALGMDGNLYGTTQYGGASETGVYFKYSLTTGFTSIASFPATPPNPTVPDSALIQAPNGVFFGTSAYGGANAGGGVYAITNSNSIVAIAPFSLESAAAESGICFGANGQIYGTVASNLLNEGSLFTIATNGILSYNFSLLGTNAATNSSGASPSAAPTPDSAGNLYGTTAAGGSNGTGVVFQIYGPDFIPPSLGSNAVPPHLTTNTMPPDMTNTLVGSPLTFSYSAQGFTPLSLQWTLNGTNYTNSALATGTTSNTLTINEVMPSDVGGFALVASNTWGSITSAVTSVTVDTPSIAISSPAPNASTNAPVFAGTATIALISKNIAAIQASLTNVTYSISNILLGSNIVGNVALSPNSAGVSNWSFHAVPYPGSNILTVQVEDATGNLSPPASVPFFYQANSPLTIVTRGSGAATLSITNGQPLFLGATYTITALPISSVFSNWNVQGTIFLRPALSFEMQPGLVLTATLGAKQLPLVTITNPTANVRTATPVLGGTAQSSPLLAGVNSNNVRLTAVNYWLTNTSSQSVASGLALMTSGTGVSNWTITTAPSPGSNILAVQCSDASSEFSPIVSRPFFYIVPSLFGLTNSGNGSGSVTGTASIRGDVPPTNGALLNVGEAYTLTAKAAPFSTFAGWKDNSGNKFPDSTLTFMMQPGLSFGAEFDGIAPTVAITSPADNLRTTAPVFSGTANGHFGVTNITFSVVNNFFATSTNGHALLASGSGGNSNWTFTLTPSPGTNILSVQATDGLGSLSARASRTFFYILPAPLTVSNNGTGSGSASLSNGTLLDLGQGYTITATPANGSLFSNWTSSLGGQSTSPQFSFLMSSNLVLTATFITNFFPSVAGVYNGLFYPPSAVAVENSGLLSDFTLSGTGAVSGKLMAQGSNFTVAGAFNGVGQGTFTAGPFRLSLTLHPQIPEITGTVNAGRGVANLTAEIASNTIPSSQYTLLLSPFGAVTNSPTGDGYVLLTNDNGALTLSGALADGSIYLQKVGVAPNGDVPVFANPKPAYSGAQPGLLIGWINLTNIASPASLTWIEKAIRVGRLTVARYPIGFTNSMVAVGSPWTNPPEVAFTNGNLTVTNAAFALDYTNVVLNQTQISQAGALPPHALSGMINPTTGLLTLTFQNEAGSNVTATGTLLQNSTNAGGFFLTPTNAGAFFLKP